MNNKKLETSSKVAVLLVNLGTPDNLGYWAIRRYLSEFLSDKHVINKPRWLWLPFLQLVLLSFIPFRSAKKYATIWDYKNNQSPLKTISQMQVQALKKSLAKTVSKDANNNETLSAVDIIKVDYAMRYGNPSLEKRLYSLVDSGCDKIVILPLYPQYSETTVASTMLAISKVITKLIKENSHAKTSKKRKNNFKPRNLAEFCTIAPYYQHSSYISALSEQISDARTEFYKIHKRYPQKVVLSYHGLPQSYIDAGDPYQRQCLETSQLIKDKLALDENQCEIITTFQSKFGRDAWITPSTEQTLVDLAQGGIEDVIISTPGFASDCVETLEEIGIELQEVFLKHGGKTFTIIPCLNANQNSVKMMEELIVSKLG